MPPTTTRIPHSVQRRNRQPRPETPLQRIEGEAFGVSVACLTYRSHATDRLAADRACDDAVRRMERAFRANDGPAFWAAADDYWLADHDEDAAAASGDGRVTVAHGHAKVIAGAVEAIERATASSRRTTDLMQALVVESAPVEWP